MNIKQIFVNYLTETDPWYYLPVVAALVFMTGVLWFTHKYRPRWKYFAWGVLIILLVRGALFDQYFSWRFYRDHLNAVDVGWRQQSILPIEHDNFLKYERKLKFLAVGSSQTYHIYSSYSQKHPELVVFNLAGMGPLDFYLYRKYISARNPEYILLYLSEFDFAREPYLSAAKTAPAQGIGFFRILPVLHQLSKQAHSEMDLKEMIAGEFFPEYRYAFIFKGLFNKAIDRNKVFHGESFYADLHPDRKQLDKNIADMTEDGDERWIAYHTYFLTEFLSYCGTKSIKVIIVEGQFNPLAYNEKNQILHQEVHKVFQDIVKRFDFITFLPRASIMALTEEDYTDVMHVKPEAGYRFTESLIKKLEIMGIK